jgi:hypothetical protein
VVDVEVLLDVLVDVEVVDVELVDVVELRGAVVVVVVASVVVEGSTMVGLSAAESGRPAIATPAPMLTRARIA